MEIITILLYLMAIVCRWLGLSRPTLLSNRQDPYHASQASLNINKDWDIRGQQLAFGIGCVAWLCHGYLLHEWINLGLAQDISLFNMLSFIVWLVVLFIIVNHFTRWPLDYFIVFVFPLAIFSILLILSFPDHYVLKVVSIQTWVHISVSVIALSMLCISALQAFFLIRQEKQLKSKASQHRDWHFLPSIQTMEARLFRFVLWGFIFLSLALISSTYFFWQSFFVIKVMDKAILGLLAWLILGTLLLGHRYFGWRGYRVAYGVLLGFVLLMTAYLVYQLTVELFS